MTDIEKLRVMLPHWIEHNISHNEEFRKWADITEKLGRKDIAGLLGQAITGLSEADRALAEALEKLGGPLKKGEDGHHHHH